MTRVLVLDGAFDAGVTTAPVDPNESLGSIVLYDFARDDCWDGDPTSGVTNLVAPRATAITGAAQSGAFDGNLANIRRADGALQIGRDLARLKIGGVTLTNYMVGRNIAVSAFYRGIQQTPMRKWVAGMAVEQGEVIYHTMDPNLFGGADIREPWTVTRSGVWSATEPQYFSDAGAEYDYGTARAYRGVQRPGSLYTLPVAGNVLGTSTVEPLTYSSNTMETSFLSAGQLLERAKINATATSADAYKGPFAVGVDGSRRLATAPTKRQLAFYCEDFATQIYNSIDAPDATRIGLYRLHIEDLTVSGRSLADFYDGERDAFARISPARGLLGA